VTVTHGSCITQNPYVLFICPAEHRIGNEKEQKQLGKEEEAKDSKVACCHARHVHCS